MLWLERRCQEPWHEIPHRTLPGSVADVWAEERATLMQLPPAFDGFVEHSKRVSPTCLISFERNRYSVPASSVDELARHLARVGGVHHIRLAGVVIECLDWADFIPRYDGPGTLFYLDPPYWGCETDYGKPTSA